MCFTVSRVAFPSKSQFLVRAYVLYVSLLSFRRTLYKFLQIPLFGFDGNHRENSIFLPFCV